MLSELEKAPRMGAALLVLVGAGSTQLLFLRTGGGKEERKEEAERPCVPEGPLC